MSQIGEKQGPDAAILMGRSHSNIYEMNLVLDEPRDLIADNLRQAAEVNYVYMRLNSAVDCLP